MKKLMMTMLGAVACGAAAAATVYLSPTGDDTAAGTEAAPKRTIQLVLNSMKNGDEIVLLPGTYHLQTQKVESASMSSEDGYLHTARTGVVRGSTGNPADVVIDGDGVTVCTSFGSTDLQIQGITFQNGGQSGNASGTVGSNLSIQNKGVFVSNCVIRGTAPTSQRPAVSLAAGARMSNCTFQDLKGSPRPNQKNTSALYLVGTNVVENCRFVDCVTTNVTTEYDALVNGSAGSTIRNCTFLRSVERPLVLRGDAVVEGCSFVSNSVTKSGGAIYVDQTAGGAVITNCVFDGNAATNHGGAIAYTTSKENPVRVTGCVFTGNTAGLTSGAISVGYPNRSDAYLYLDNSVFSNNVALVTKNEKGCWGGGAIYFRGTNDGSNVTCGGEIVNCEFVGNRAAGSSACGGALCMRMMPGSSYVPNGLLIRNCLFAKNACVNQGGAMYLLNDSTTVDYVVESCTIVDNTAKDANNGPAIYQMRASLCITNTVFASNLLCMNSSYDYSAKCVNCCFDPTQATSNYKMANAKDSIFADPKFADQAGGDYRLAAKSSPCVDKGVAADWMAKAFDLDGRKRLFGAAPDMGCYEFRYPLGFLMIIR